MFTPKTGFAWYLWIFLGLLLSGAVVALLQLVPTRFRRNLILGVTFLGGLFYAVEFFWPTRDLGGGHEGNFLTPLVPAFTDFTVTVSALTVGLGVINLFQIHGKRLIKGGNNAFNSFMFFLSMFVMFVIQILNKHRPNAINKNLNELFFTGAYSTLDATMFSIIAFYIVSAAYRAFRVRSPEATLLLVTAIIVMVGQTAVGQLLTSFLPANPDAFAHNFRVEIVRDWILTKANTPVTRAINFGLGVGSLAVALRIWLGLERGSYFDSQG